MGCWNESCCISGLPILEGENVYAVYLGRRNGKKSMYDYKSYCYPTDIWQPFGYFVKGKYNGYGRLDVSEDIWSLKNSEMLKEYTRGNSANNVSVKTSDYYDLEIVFFNKNILESILKKYENKKEEIWNLNFNG